jgi:hypothetical protein
VRFGGPCGNIAVSTDTVGLNGGPPFPSGRILQRLIRLIVKRPPLRRLLLLPAALAAYACVGIAGGGGAMAPAAVESSGEVAVPEGWVDRYDLILHRGHPLPAPSRASRPDAEGGGQAEIIESGSLEIGREGQVTMRWNSRTLYGDDRLGAIYAASALSLRMKDVDGERFTAESSGGREVFFRVTEEGGRILPQQENGSVWERPAPLGERIDMVSLEALPAEVERGSVHGVHAVWLDRREHQASWTGRAVSRDGRIDILGRPAAFQTHHVGITTDSGLTAGRHPIVPGGPVEVRVTLQPADGLPTPFILDEGTLVIDSVHPPAGEWDGETYSGVIQGRGVGADGRQVALAVRFWTIYEPEHGMASIGPQRDR